MTIRRGPKAPVEIPRGFLARLRVSADLTQVELAEEVETSLSTIVRSERNDQVSHDLAIALGASFSNLFGFEIDLRNKAEISRIDEHLQRGSRPVPDVPPSLPDIRTPPKQKMGDVNPTSGSIPIMPPGLNEDRATVGRDDDAKIVHDMMFSRLAKRDGTRIVLKGQGGIGKSTLGRYFISLYSGHFDGVWWLRSETERTLVADLCELGQTLGMSDRGNGPDAFARSVLVFLQSNTRNWLIVYDNAYNYEMLRRWVPSGNHVRLLFTSREASWPDNFVLIEVERLASEDALKLLLDTSNRTDIEPARRLSEALDGLPLAIVTAGSWLRRTPKTSFEEYLRELDTRIREAPTLANGYPLSVFGSLSLSFETLSPSAKRLMEYISFLAPDHIAPEIFFGLAGKDRGSDRYSDVHDMLWEAEKAPAVIETAITELEEKSLISRQSRSYRVHRLTQSVFRMTMPNPADAWNSTAGLVSASYPGKEPDGSIGARVDNRHVWPQCRKINPHVEHLFMHRVRHRTSIPFEYIINQAGIYLGYNRLSNIALRYSIEYLRRKKARLPRGHIEIGRGYHNLSYRFTPLGRAVWAEASARRAVEILRLNVDVPDSRRVRWLANLGHRIRNRANTYAPEQKHPLLSEARLVLHEAIRIIRASGNKHDINTGLVMNALGLVHESLCRLGAARLMFALAVKRTPDASGEKQMEFVTRISNLGRVEVKANRALEGKEHLGAAIAIREDAYRGNYAHPVLIANAMWLAVAERLLGDRAGVDALVERYGQHLDHKEIEERALSITNQNI
ncbi:NB-ARC domain-containing protein [Nitratireductor alexandrii]|uniref:DUF7779 domain-containing protein n=1 Tax=Nitratireductor alexandrii TaxID=2448161 RepID=UPI0013DEAFAC|nr:NB-ARC domain-containing protein [Nitratireductor alexandrii]